MQNVYKSEPQHRDNTADAAGVIKCTSIEKRKQVLHGSSVAFLSRLEYGSFNKLNRLAELAKKILLH